MNLFQHGSVWLRADFHLHTRADKEAFKDWDAENISFKKEYVKKLKEEDICIGIITNHNKFDSNEFKAMASEARKEEVFLMPGVELSVGEGNGIHILVVFEADAWLSQHDDFINRYLDEAYSLARQDRENRNARTNWNLIQTLEKLNKHKQNGRNAFVILAHIDQDNGFCYELNEGRQQELVDHSLFKEFVIGFQKWTNSTNKQNLLNWYKPAVPAFVEGCDCKNIGEIGKTRKKKNQDQKTYLKIGDYNFYAVKYALMDPKRNVVDVAAPKSTNAFIESIEFQTTSDAPLAGKKFYFSSNMNNLIGIRGSGKSTILEVIRYALHKQFETSAKDTDYKERLVEHALRSGGKVILKLKDKHHRKYRIERVLGERLSIFRDDVRLPQFSVEETLINVLYFGQKDLSEVGSAGFSQALMEKFFGAHVGPVREQIDQKRKRIIDILDDLKGLQEVSERKNEFLQDKAALNERLRIFKEKKVDEKLKRQIQFNKDRLQIARMIETTEGFQNELNQIVDNSMDVFNDYAVYKSPENRDIFADVQKTWKNIISKLDQVNQVTSELENDLKSLRQSLTEIDARIDRLRDDFAEIKRTINIPEINPDDFINFSKRLNLVEAKLGEIEKNEAKYLELQKLLKNNLRDLNELWHKEYQTLQSAIDELNAKNFSITGELKYKGDKKSFRDYLSSIFQGSGLTSKNLNTLIDSYNDCIEFFYDLKTSGSKLEQILSAGSQLQKFYEYFNDNLRNLLTYQVPNQYILKYKGKNISEHSLGQRASALILFLLARRENDLIIIDQPEDDIDNQSIYEDVIRELNNLKEQTQFIFATHNPNIPVLGECEQVFCCRYENEKINLEIGSVDRPETQKSIIEIMEGGQEAFEQRKRKYSEWKH